MRSHQLNVQRRFQKRFLIPDSVVGAAITKVIESFEALKRYRSAPRALNSPKRTPLAIVRGGKAFNRKFSRRAISAVYTEPDLTLYRGRSDSCVYTHRDAISQAAPKGVMKLATSGGGLRFTVTICWNYTLPPTKVAKPLAAFLHINQIDMEFFIATTSLRPLVRPF
ncbi:hypothetical protein EVAR_18422_1 [Eumeta japonica]|uniref:Uncharacterized protein n=1 Tax=Eumeta variegata TaxID=151549 RepID=A0A4C1UVC9_EUMVA|nr:hypothetical protein EVAR_18422_1 [Eumeta japonica]